MTTHWHLEFHNDIILLGLDYADGPVNLLARPVLDELAGVLEKLERDPPRALILRSLKTTGFLAGADVSEFVGVGDRVALRARIGAVHRLFNRLEALPCPTLALIDGFCLGGGLELALACRYRIAVDAPRTRIGFPEVKLGIFPAYGGTWRSIRAIGALRAMPLMLSGRTLSARQARRMGLVDRAVPRRQLMANAHGLLDTHPPARRAGPIAKLVNLPPLRPLLAARMARATRAHARPEHYPAPYALVEHWRRCGGGRDCLLHSERALVADLLPGETAQNLIRVFGLQERLKALGRIDVAATERVQVVGAGTMGGDIAAWCALKGLRVGLQDLSMEQIGRAMGRARKLFERKLKDPRLVRDAWDRLMPDPTGTGLAHADLLIEAVVEHAEIKRNLLSQLTPRLRPDALVATNTSSIPLEDLRDAVANPERLIGLHFFNPVARMQLVEVISDAATDASAQARGCAFVRRIARLPLPVASAPGFLVNRVLVPYLLEAVDLLDEGVPAPVIDEAALAFGMPMGPVELADSIGLDICLSVADKLGFLLSAPEQTPEALRRLVADGRLGRKTGAGFYRWHRGKPRKGRLVGAGKAPSDLTERLIFRLLNESVAVLNEGLVADADLLDAGVIFGTGFAPFRGGPMHYIASGGWDRMLDRLRALERSHGEHFHPDTGWTNAAAAGSLV